MYTITAEKWERFVSLISNRPLQQYLKTSLKSEFIVIFLRQLL